MSDFGRVHSIESFSAVDGPGIRAVIFLQGCFLQCIYCHNPDTWDVNGGKIMHYKEVVDKVEEYRAYLSNGGITLSGGEPLLQKDFTKKLLKEFKKKGFHTVCETAASLPFGEVFDLLEYLDLVILDLKALEVDECEKICRLDVENSISFLDNCEKLQKKVWVRHVLLPHFTLNYSKLEGIAEFLKGYSVIERIELLPFHKLGEHKWKKLGFSYSLYDVKVPNEDEFRKSAEIFKSKGLPVVC